MENDNRNPTHKEVQFIFKDTYNFYLKWVAVKEVVNWEDVLEDGRLIERQYPFELCRKILLELIDIIEKNYMERTQSDG